MSEKRKWFDSRKAEIRYYPVRLASASNVSAAQCLHFMNALNSLYERKRVPADVHELFIGLGMMQPVHRLSRNLASLIRILGKRPVGSIIREGLTDLEYQALVHLERLNMPADMKATAQGLLNVYERSQVAEVARRFFEEERCRCWEVSDA